ncbi:sodium/calcium exchanger MaX1 [Halalkalicoccus paucihalophilus]|uniref:Sodium/calcium exchanger MaX1 n=1 Tax=Halalkalicoccus paucihalophilus TaxID=1008153 RepID=A0A151AEW6_9EURY|nr:sodium:proton exchanger [Halalkalicoccus paucihalophilus]KYH26226.1 sodium/calcium exchanger MaX1 [Halalkalicoccus paucihalophilus]
MSRRRFVTLLLVVLLTASVVAVPVMAQEDGEEGEEGGIEGAIEGFIEGQGLLGAVLVLAFGVVLLTVCVEKLISYLARAAIGMKMSLFALAIVFTGFEFDDTILGLVLASGGLEGAALGTALGTGLAIIGVTLAIAAIVRPFPVDLPNDYIALFALAPVVLIPFVMLGTLTLVPGLVLLGFFVLSFAYFIVRERGRDVPVFRSTELGAAIEPDGGTEVRPDGGTAFPEPLSEIPEDRLVGDRSGWIWIGFSVLALAGVVFAAMLLEGGSEVAIEGFGIEGTVFGATFLTLILTFEDIMLTIEPVRRGLPEIGVGNVIGSVLFSMTGNIGVLTLVSTVTIAPSVLTFHLPAIIVVTALSAYFMYRGEVKRWHGVLLLGLYIAYWVIALTVFGGVPIGE